MQPAAEGFPRVYTGRESFTRHRMLCLSAAINFLSVQEDFAVQQWKRRLA
jgi:hypothetical protein